MRSYLEFLNLQKAYPTVRGNFVAVEDFTLNVNKGEFVSIIGHSGCGKSTVLSMVAGLNSITSGSIVLANREVVGPGPDRGVVFQSPSLFPWMTALENVMLGVKKVFPYASKEERYEVCRYYLTRVGLGQHLDKKAIDLSSGMQQRVGIARAFALKPKLLLLDEPFGMLDSLTRTELQSVLMEVWAKEKITAIMVTHDVDEAVLMSDRVVMMTNGPRARLGDVLPINFPRPRLRSEILDTDQYYQYREYLIDFLERYEKVKPIQPPKESDTKSKIAV